MLTKRDRELLIADLKPVFATKDDLKSMEERQDRKYATKDDLKGFATKDDLKGFATKDDLTLLAKHKDLVEIRKDLSTIKNDLRDVKTKLYDLYNFSVKAFGNLFDWVEDIHQTIVKKNLSKRVERLEKSVGLEPVL